MNVTYPVNPDRWTEEPRPIYDHYLVMTVTPGVWGRGATIMDAIKVAKGEGLGDGNKVRLFECTAKAHVDEMGNAYGVNLESHLIGTVRGRRILHTRPA